MSVPPLQGNWSNGDCGQGVDFVAGAPTPIKDQGHQDHCILSFHFLTFTPLRLQVPTITYTLWVTYIPWARSKKVKALSHSELTTGQIRLGYKWSPTRGQVEWVLLGAAGLQSGTLPLGQDTAHGTSSRLRALIL